MAGLSSQLNRPMLDLQAPRVHSTAPQTNAQAYATGSDIHFGAGAAGGNVIPHEAWHVVQQRAGIGGASVAAANTAVGHYGH